MSAPAPTSASASAASSPPQPPSQDLAQTMGFSTFGAAPNPPKRRKLHQDIEGGGTGGNSIPLGRRREEGGRGVARNAGDAGEEHPGEEGEEGEEEQDDERALEQLKSAALKRLGIAPISATLPPKPPPSTPHHTHPTRTSPQPLGHDSGTGVVAHGGDTVAQGGDAASQGGDAVTQRERAGKEAHDWRALRKGVRDENGDVAYYDGSFVEDPWRCLVG